MTWSLNIYRAVIFSVLTFSFLQVSAQNPDTRASLTGLVEVIKDSTNLFFPAPNFIESNPYALPGATVILMRPDSTYVAGSAADRENSRFEIIGIQSGTYILEANYIGYETTTFPIRLHPGEKWYKNVELGHIYSPEHLPFGAEEALNDIKNGTVEIRIMPTVGCFFGDPELQDKFNELERQLRKKYGFTEQDVGDLFKTQYNNNWEKLRQAIIRYNNIVEQHLAKINGANWQKRFEKELQQAKRELVNKSRE